MIYTLTRLLLIAYLRIIVLADKIQSVCDAQTSWPNFIFPPWSSLPMFSNLLFIWLNQFQFKKIHCVGLQNQKAQVHYLHFGIVMCIIIFWVLKHGKTMKNIVFWVEINLKIYIIEGHYKKLHTGRRVLYYQQWTYLNTFDGLWDYKKCAFSLKNSTNLFIKIPLPSARSVCFNRSPLPTTHITKYR